MKRFDVAGCTGYCYGGYHMKEDVDGEYVTYESHVEVMKRIAGAPVAQGLTREDQKRIAWDVQSVTEPLQGTQEPVAIICDGWDIRYIGREPIAGIIEKHGLKIGSKLYAAPAPSDSGPLINKGTKPVTAEDVRANRRNGESMWDTKARLEGAPSASPICTCPSGDGSLRHPCPSHPSASPEPYNAYQRDWEKVVRWVKVQSETFPELASMSPEGAISWLVVELAARHEKFAEPSASPAALTDEQALDISIDLGMVRKDYGGYFVNKLTVEEIMEAIRSLCAESPAAPIAAETEPMAWLFVKSGKKMKIFVRAEASELLDGHYPLFGQSASQLKRHVPQANEQFIAPKLELLAASPAALTDELIALLKNIRPNYGDVGTRDVDVAAQQKRIDRAIALLAASPAATAQDFDAWQANPYTQVLQKSIHEDYVPKADASPAALTDGWNTVSVYGFDELMAALHRADEKGYMPDAMRDEWAAFDYNRIAASPADQVAPNLADACEALRTAFLIGNPLAIGMVRGLASLAKSPRVESYHERHGASSRGGAAMTDTKLDLDSIETKATGRGSLARIVRKLVARIRDLENASAAPAVAAMPDGWAFSKDGYGNWKIDAPTGDQILVRASSTSVRADVLRNLCADLLKVPTNRTT